MHQNAILTSTVSPTAAGEVHGGEALGAVFEADGEWSGSVAQPHVPDWTLP